MIDFSINLEVKDTDYVIETETSNILLVKDTLSRFVKSTFLSMFKMLAPNVYVERNNQKCVEWAADSFLLSENPNLSSFKGNIKVIDSKSEIIYKRKQ